jgi:alpha-galactosidase/6-phospho-beta-glucosidase family protein
MPKITFMGADSTVFARNVLGDAMCSPALADINGQRLKERVNPEYISPQRQGIFACATLPVLCPAEKE